MRDLTGACLCGEIGFVITGEVPNVYQCHCSLCRKVTGSACNAALLVSEAQFKWTTEVSTIRAFVTESGFKSHFCPQCSCSLPNQTREGLGYWVPLGLIANPANINLTAQFYIDSKASWDNVCGQGAHFSSMPKGLELCQLLGMNNNASCDWLKA